MGVSGQPHAPAALPLEQELSATSQWEAGWAPESIRAFRKWGKSPSLMGTQFFCHPACRLVTTMTELSWHHTIHTQHLRNFYRHFQMQIMWTPGHILNTTWEWTASGLPYSCSKKPYATHILWVTLYEENHNNPFQNEKTSNSSMGLTYFTL